MAIIFFHRFFLMKMMNLPNFFLMKNYYPSGAAPIVRGEAVNTATTYGYDSVTMMQETKTTICNIERVTA